MNKCTKEQFLKDTKDHKMAIIFDGDNDNVRHISFKKPGTNALKFDLVTWLGHLCIAGDMGTYVFARTQDMFGFFRRDELTINDDYWAEKCLSGSEHEKISKFSVELFKANVQEYFDDYMCDEKPKNKEVWWASVKESGVEMVENESDAIDWAYHAGNSSMLDGAFLDFWEVSHREYTYHFIWCLYAIVWGIQRYDLEAHVCL